MSEDNNTEKKPLRMRATEVPETFVRIETAAAEEVKTAYRPIQKTDSKPLLSNSVIAIAMTVLMIAGGAVCYKMISDRTERISGAERAAQQAQSERDKALRIVPEMTARIEANARAVKNELTRAEREAKSKVETESGQETLALRNSADRAKVDLSFAGKDAASKADAVTRKLTGELNEARIKVDGVYDKNRETKLWLNANRRTLHGPYEIGPRP